jgi:ApaG protein
MTIRVTALATYLAHESAPDEARYAFAYTIRIHNGTQKRIQLLSRHWIITDANGGVREVKGDGVVGEQPVLRPGEAFEYTSGSLLPTEVGTMRGSYRFRDDDDTAFDIAIPEFVLSPPRVLH